MTSDPAETAELLERAGEAASDASFAGRHEVAERHLRHAIEIRHHLGDRPAIARATAALGKALLAASKPAESIDILESGATEFADLDIDPGFIALLGQLARAYFLHEDLVRAIEVADRTLAAAERADLREITADTLVTKGSALAYLGRAIEGLGLLAAAQALAESNGFDGTVMRAVGNLASIVREPRPEDGPGLGPDRHHAGPPTGRSAFPHHLRRERCRMCDPDGRLGLGVGRDRLDSHRGSRRGRSPLHAGVIGEHPGFAR